MSYLIRTDYIAKEEIKDLIERLEKGEIIYIQ